MTWVQSEGAKQWTDVVPTRRYPSFRGRWSDDDRRSLADPFLSVERAMDDGKTSMLRWPSMTVSAAPDKVSRATSRHTYDAILVFGAGINQDGELTLDSRVRVDLAVARWKAHVAPMIVFCGKWSFSRSDVPIKTEADGMADYAVSLGVDRANTLTEQRSTDTLGNAYFAFKDFIERQGWKHVLVIVADYHISRTAHYCRKVFGARRDFSVEGAMYPCAPNERERLQRRQIVSQAVLDDWLKDISEGDDASIWNLMNTIHPGYATHPKYSLADTQKMILEKERALFPNSTPS